LREQKNNIYQLDSKRLDKKTKLTPKNKSRKKIKKSSILVLCVFLYILGFFAYQGIRIYQLRQEEKALMENVRLLEKEKERYQAELDSAQSEEYIENFARENLRMVKENEILYVPKKQENKTEEK